MLNDSEKLSVDVVCNMTPRVAEARVSELCSQKRLGGILIPSERKELLQLRLGLALAGSEETLSFKARFNSRLEQVIQRRLS